LKTSVAVIILTLNEEPTIIPCLRQFKEYHFNYILVLDGGSTDRTVELAKPYADKIKVRPFSGSFAEEKNYAWSLLPRGCDWVLFSDVDEVWPPDFLLNYKEIIHEAERNNIVCFRFPRVELPDPLKSWPDYQIRLVKNNGEFTWKGATHEYLWWVKGDLSLDNIDNPNLLSIPLGIGNLDNYHTIIHLPRRKDLQRAWWNESK